MRIIETVFFGVLLTCFCLMLSLAIPSVGYGIFCVIGPTTEVARIILGLGLSVLLLGPTIWAAIASFALWITGMSELL